MRKKKSRKNIETGTGATNYNPKIRKACKWRMAASELPTIIINKPEQPFNRATAPMTQEGHKNRKINQNKTEATIITNKNKKNKNKKNKNNKQKEQ